VPCSAVDTVQAEALLVDWNGDAANAPDARPRPNANAPTCLANVLREFFKDAPELLCARILKARRT
jgi:hypothetical protein